MAELNLDIAVAMLIEKMIEIEKRLDQLEGRPAIENARREITQAMILKAREEQKAIDKASKDLIK